jgi:small subunit ribosomal protein S19
MTRSIWKGPFVDSHLLKKVKSSVDSNKNTVIKTWSRRSTILPEFVGVNFAVHNGKRFIPVNITEDMVSFLLPERLVDIQGTRRLKVNETSK